ncbi:hypothetical protein D3C87_1601970 [compost metagenome]
MLIENADVKSDKLFMASDIKGFTVRNAKVETKDANISLLGTRQLTFENVDFLVPENALEVSVTSSEEPLFIHCKPRVINLSNK